MTRCIFQKPKKKKKKKEERRQDKTKMTIHPYFGSLKYFLFFFSLTPSIISVSLDKTDQSRATTLRRVISFRFFQG